MCDLQSFRLDVKAMDVSSNELRLAGILAMVVLAIAALVIDGDMGETLMTAIVGGIGVAVGYLFGVKRCTDAEEVPE